MRAITVRQPWAWAIIHGGKDVENRNRNIAGKYRGPVAIHAGLAVVEAIVEDHPLRDALSAAVLASRRRVDLYRGFVIGVVDLVDVHPDCTESVEGFGHTPTCSPWAMPDHHHMLLANPRPLFEPIASTGRLGLWTLPDDVEAAVLAQIEGAS